MKGCIAVLLGAVCWSALAQPQFEPAATRAQIRDAVVHAGTGRIYAAAYNEDQVWVFDPRSRERLAQIPAGKGPVALVLSPDGALLACLNRGDNSVTLLHVPEDTVLATVLVGEGPTAIAPLGVDTFLVANTFGDSLSLVDAAAGTATTLGQAAVGVPTAVASAGGFCAAIGRVTPSLTLFNEQGGSAGSVALPAPPVALAAFGDTFAVATVTELLLVDPAAQRITAHTVSTAKELSASAGSLYALDPATGAVTEFNATLEPTTTWTAPAQTQRLRVSEGVYLALAPQTQSWQVGNPAGVSIHTPAPVAIVEAAPTVAGASSPVPETPTPTPGAVSLPSAPSVPVAPDVPSVPVAPAVPAVPVAPAVPSVPAVPVVPVPAALAPEAPPAPPENETAPIAATETRPGQVKKYPVRTDSIGAPHLGERPSAVPMRQLSRKTIADALVQPTEFGSEEAGFKAPDWTQPFRDIQFEQMKSAPNADALELQGDVHLRLGDMYFKSDQFSYDRLMGMIHAEGNIEVTQQASKMTAQEFTYEIPGPEAVPVEGQTPFAPPLTEQERERGRLTLGRLYAKNVYVDEPTRTMSAEEIQYDFATKTGEMLHVHGQAGIYYYSADKLRILGPASAEGDEVWVTTCDRDPPHYKIRLKRAKIEEGTAVGGNSARLQLGSMDTPFFLPTWQRGGVGAYPWTLDFDSGRRADIGYFVNIGQRFEVTPDVALGPRIFPTEKQGVGFGGDLEYDFSKNPASWLYRTKGEAHGLYTTEDRGYLHWYHRYDYDQNLTLRIQAEQWSDSEFYKDFFYDHYRNRSTPRTFANVTYRQEDYIATGTVKLNTHNWINETERFPEATFHVLERPLLDHLYLTFDTVDGFNDREQYGANAVRSVNVLRLTYDWDPLPALAITPFVELEGTWYSKQRADDSAASRFSSLYGVTAQTRFHREYPGRWGFSAFKHVVVPSVTYSYQPEASLDVNSAPRFDNLDNAFGRSRIETKLDNLLYGRDAETKEVWQVARLTLYQGNDLWNEIQKSHDYELELDIRPRPWGGFQLVGERHDVSSEFSLYDYEFQDRFVRFYERVFERPFDRETSEFFDESFQDYNRVLAQLYYEERPLNARIGFSYTETRNEVYNREVLYGLGYEINDKWGVGFEHRYDFEDNTLRSQTYEVRRSLHCWETALRVRDRESGFDIDIEFNIKAFPGTRLKL